MRNVLLLISGIFFSLSIFAANVKTASAASISLYDQPNANAKVIGTLSTDQALIPIYTRGEWTKVGNPNNGDVGWINNKILSQYGIPKIYLKTDRKTTDNGTEKSFQMFQFSDSDGGNNDQQMETIVKQLQAQQAKFQANFNDILQQTINNFNELSKQLQQLQKMTPIPAVKNP